MIFGDLEMADKHGQALVGHGDDAVVRLDGAEGIIGRLRLARARDGVEERAFPTLGRPTIPARNIRGLSLARAEGDGKAGRDRLCAFARYCQGRPAAQLVDETRIELAGITEN